MDQRKIGILHPGQMGVPGGFHAAAAEIYDRLASFKDAPETPSLDSVLAALAQTTQSEPS